MHVMCRKLWQAGALASPSSCNNSKSNSMGTSHVFHLQQYKCADAAKVDIASCVVWPASLVVSSSSRNLGRYKLCVLVVVVVEGGRGQIACLRSVTATLS